MSEDTVRRIDPTGDHAKAVMGDFNKNSEAINEMWGAEIAGYAVVVWNGRGQTTCAYRTQNGPIGQDFMPTFVERTLSAQVTIVRARDE